MGSATGSFTRLNKRLAQQEAALNPESPDECWNHCQKKHKQCHWNRKWLDPPPPHLLLHLLWAHIWTSIKNVGIPSSAAISLLHFLCQFENPSQSDMWQIGRHFTNARDENNKSTVQWWLPAACGFYWLYSHQYTPNTTPVHTQT